MTKINFALNRKGAKRVSSKLKMRLTLKGPKQLNDEGPNRLSRRAIFLLRRVDVNCLKSLK
jgi:hypothetical protein